MALDFLLANQPAAFLAGMDVGTYGSAFKTCKGLVDRYGADRVIDMPLAESSIMGFALGASQTGAEPIIEFQFADFSTEAVTQLGLNAGTWYFRTGCAAPMLVRLPCGGGLTVGAFHSGEFEGLWSRFPGLKLLYPATPQETYEALLAGFYDPNPCLVFEHKLLYWSRSGDIDFDGDLQAVWRPRRYTEGTDLTLVALGAMVQPSLAAAAQSGGSVEVWNPLVLQPLDIGPIAESVQEDGPAAGRAGIGRDARSGRPAHFAVDARVLPVAEGSAGTDFHARRADPLRPRTGDRLPPQPGEDPQGDCGDVGCGTVAKGCLKVYATSGTTLRRGFMEAIPFRMPLYLPAQGASETEATIIEWRVTEGDRFQRGQILAQVDSAKSVFDFEAPCSGLVIRVLRLEGETVPLVEAVLEIETSDAAMREWIPPAAEPRRSGRGAVGSRSSGGRARAIAAQGVVIQGVGGYLPSRVVTNAELVKGFPELTDQYVYEVTGIRQRRWADDDERPSGMAFKASLEAIRNSGLDTRDIDAIIVATTTPDMAIPSTAAILQQRLSLPTVPAFDLNAACSGWLYAVANARGMIVSGLARHVLTVGVEMQSRLLDAADRNAYFLFGDGAGRRSFRPAPRAIASVTCRSAATAGASTWPAARPPATSCPTGMAIRGSASTATPCSALPRRVFPR